MESKEKLIKMEDLLTLVRHKISLEEFGIMDADNILLDEETCLLINSKIIKRFGVSIIHEVELGLLYLNYLDLYYTTKKRMRKELNLIDMGNDEDLIFEGIASIHSDLKYCFIFALITSYHRFPNILKIDGISNKIVAGSAFRLSYLTQINIFGEKYNKQDFFKRPIDININEVKIAENIFNMYLELIKL